MNWRPTVHSKTNVFFITHLYQTKATITKGCKGGVQKENIIEQGQSFKQHSKMKAHQIMTRTTLSQCILCHAENGTFQYRCCTGSRVTRRESYTLSTKHRLLFSYSSFYWIQRAEPFNKWMAQLVNTIISLCTLQTATRTQSRTPKKQCWVKYVVIVNLSKKKMVLVCRWCNWNFSVSVLVYTDKLSLPGTNSQNFINTSQFLTSLTWYINIIEIS